MIAFKAVIVALVLVVLGVLAVQPAVAQQRQGRQGPPPPGDVSEGRGGRGPGPGRGAPDVMALQGLFDSYVLMQAQSQLQLSTDQAPQFILRLKELQDTRRRGQMRRGRIIQQMRQRTQGPGRDGGGDAEEIQRLLAELKTADAESAGQINQAVASLDQVLNVRQRARFRILEEQMERNKLDILMRARRGAPPPQF